MYGKLGENHNAEALIKLEKSVKTWSRIIKNMVFTYNVYFWFFIVKYVYR
jgi:hypothetical protein